MASILSFKQPALRGPGRQGGGRVQAWELSGGAPVALPAPVVGLARGDILAKWSEGRSTKGPRGRLFLPSKKPNYVVMAA